DDVLVCEALGELRWLGRVEEPRQLSTLVEDDGRSIGEAGARGLHQFKLTTELVRGPQVVVVQESEPLPSRLGDAAVARRRDPPGVVMANHLDPRVLESG